MKIWGIGYGLIGDIIMQLPLLTYFEKKYPGSYKYLVVLKKISVCVELFINHPLIDRIKVTDDWNFPGKTDLKIARSCGIIDQAYNTKTGIRKPPFNGSWCSDSRWYNKRSCVEEKAILYGVNDLTEVLNEEEMKPKLVKWFDVGRETRSIGYLREKKVIDQEIFKNSIAIWPFAGYYNLGAKRSPSPKWWRGLINSLVSKYQVYHYGVDKEILSNSLNYKSFTYLSYMQQVKMSLASPLIIGTDSGSMWVFGAYHHPSIHLITNWNKNHNTNFNALAPINDKGINLFAKKSCDNIDYSKVIEAVEGVL